MPKCVLFGKSVHPLAVACCAFIAGTVALVPIVQTQAWASPHANTLYSHDDHYSINGPTDLDSRHGVLRNDLGDPLTVVSNTVPQHGSLTMNPDGSFRYVPEPGFTGTDHFTYTTSDSVRIYTPDIAPLTTIGPVTVLGDGYGSSLYPVPGSRHEFYGLTDRGPNAQALDGAKVALVPSFTPTIGRFRFTDDGRAILEGTIPLKDANGTPYTGRVNTSTDTGERIVDVNGETVPPDDNGYDSEGLVAMRDGTFWVSDEYGPFVTHFNMSGRQIGRLSPFDATLPAELMNRVPNRGIEGLTVTPDGSTLVGIMQSALRQPDVPATAVAGIRILRIFTCDLKSGQIHEYLYPLQDSALNTLVASEITALSATTFLVDERDGLFPPNADKKLWKIDLAGATDVGPATRVPGASYHGGQGGLLLNGATIEARVSTLDSATATASLARQGITVAAKRPFLDLTGLLATLNPTGGFFCHDKVEGVAVLDSGRTVVLSNDSDFGVDLISTDTVPYQPHAKIQPATGAQDRAEFLAVDLTRLPARTSTATVTLTVRAKTGDMRSSALALRLERVSSP